jgi:hypothetical protein
VLSKVNKEEGQPERFFDICATLLEYGSLQGVEQLVTRVGTAV